MSPLARLAAFFAVCGALLVVLVVADAERTGTPPDAADTAADGAAAPSDETAAQGDEAPTPTPSPSATPGPTPTPTPAPPQSITLSFTGDLLSHLPVIAQAQRNGSAELPYDYRPMFANVDDRLSAADLAVCVLETPVSPDNTALSGYPIFNAPRELADAIEAVGFDACSTASNHSYDRGPDGVRATLDQLDRVGVGHAGMARDATEGSTPVIYDVNGIKVAHLSYTYGLNGFVLPGDQPYLVDVTEPTAVLAEAAAARAAGADLVVLALQWGNEYQSDPTEEQLALADQFTASPDIDLIVGNHVHVIQPVARVNGKWVIYGLGNFLSNQSPECCPPNSQDGVIFTVTVTGTEAEGYAVSDLTFTPTFVDRSSYTIISLPEALADPNLDPGLRSVYETSVSRTIEVVNRLGAALEPTT
jgi:poly-gamma-glutamate capsule biosynthesis protein CapA/YwtB (metallophosphatase superfamily)